MNITTNEQNNDSDSDESLLLDYLDEVNGERIESVEKTFSSYLEKSLNFQGNSQINSGNEPKEKNKELNKTIIIKNMFKSLIILFNYMIKIK